jgi:hypothetical protein
MFIAGAFVLALGVVSLAFSSRISRSYSGNRRLFRASWLFGAVMLLVVGTMWMAGIGTR